VKRWWIGLGLTLLACLPILIGFSRSSALLEDTDTAVLLAKIRERQDPLSWFGGDWPLENHFYRPISTLFFEMDNALWANNAAGYGFTNALLACLGILALFWFLRELTDRPDLATVGAVTFAAWTGGGLLQTGLGYAVLGLIGLALACCLLPGRKLLPAVAAALVGVFLLAEASGIEPISGRIVHWLPGRTASVMTLFALLAMAAYARYERISARRPAASAAPSALDLPATKSATQRPGKVGAPWIWALSAVLFAALALGSYEQAVMLPAALLGVAILMRLQGFQPRWGWQALFWGLLVAYLAMRSALVPSEVSGYQAQQFRSGPGVWLALTDYFFPAGRDLHSIWITLDFGLMLILIGSFWASLLHIAANITAYVQAAKRQWVWALGGWALSFGTFLPMAWLKPFEHYHFWPMALRSLFFAALLFTMLELIKRAASLPAIQAPPRSVPAPGSLPRP
jgi:hypothetical protein